METINGKKFKKQSKKFGSIKSLLSKFQRKKKGSNKDSDESSSEESQSESGSETDSEADSDQSSYEIKPIISDTDRSDTETSSEPEIVYDEKKSTPKQNLPGSLMKTNKKYSSEGSETFNKSKFDDSKENYFDDDPSMQGEQQVSQPRQYPNSKEIYSGQDRNSYTRSSSESSKNQYVTSTRNEVVEDLNPHLNYKPERDLGPSNRKPSKSFETPEYGNSRQQPQNYNMVVTNDRPHSNIRYKSLQNESESSDNDRRPPISNVNNSFELGNKRPSNYSQSYYEAPRKNYEPQNQVYSTSYSPYSDGSGTGDHLSRFESHYSKRPNVMYTGKKTPSLPEHKSTGEYDNRDQDIRVQIPSNVQPLMGNYRNRANDNSKSIENEIPPYKNRSSHSNQLENESFAYGKYKMTNTPTGIDSTVIQGIIQTNPNQEKSEYSQYNASVLSKHDAFISHSDSIKMTQQSVESVHSKSFNSLQHEMTREFRYLETQARPFAPDTQKKTFKPTETYEVSNTTSTRRQQRNSLNHPRELFERMGNTGAAYLQKSHEHSIAQPYRIESDNTNTVPHTVNVANNYGQDNNELPYKTNSSTYGQGYSFSAVPVTRYNNEKMENREQTYMNTKPVPVSFSGRTQPSTDILNSEGKNALYRENPSVPSPTESRRTLIGRRGSTRSNGSRKSSISDPQTFSPEFKVNSDQGKSNDVQQSSGNSLFQDTSALPIYSNSFKSPKYDFKVTGNEAKKLRYEYSETVQEDNKPKTPVNDHQMSTELNKPPPLDELRKLKPKSGFSFNNQNVGLNSNRFKDQNEFSTQKQPENSKSFEGFSGTGETNIFSMTKTTDKPKVVPSVPSYATAPKAFDFRAFQSSGLASDNRKPLGSSYSTAAHPYKHTPKILGTTLKKSYSLEPNNDFVSKIKPLVENSNNVNIFPTSQVKTANKTFEIKPSAENSNNVNIFQSSQVKTAEVSTLTNTTYPSSLSPFSRNEGEIQEPKSLPNFKNEKVEISVGKSPKVTIFRVSNSPKANDQVPTSHSRTSVTITPIRSNSNTVPKLKTSLNENHTKTSAINLDDDIPKANDFMKDKSTQVELNSEFSSNYNFFSPPRSSQASPKESVNSPSILRTLPTDVLDPPITTSKATATEDIIPSSISKDPTMENLSIAKNTNTIITDDITHTKISEEQTMKVINPSTITKAPAMEIRSTPPPTFLSHYSKLDSLPHYAPSYRRWITPTPYSSNSSSSTTFTSVDSKSNLPSTLLSKHFANLPKTSTVPTTTDNLSTGSTKVFADKQKTRDAFFKTDHSFEKSQSQLKQNVPDAPNPFKLDDASSSSPSPPPTPPLSPSYFSPNVRDKKLTPRSTIPKQDTKQIYAKSQYTSIIPRTVNIRRYTPEVVTLGSDISSHVIGATQVGTELFSSRVKSTGQDQLSPSPPPLPASSPPPLGNENIQIIN